LISPGNTDTQRTNLTGKITFTQSADVAKCEIFHERIFLLQLTTFNKFLFEESKSLWSNNGENMMSKVIRPLYCRYDKHLDGHGRYNLAN